jgi:glycerol kinase
VDKRWRPAMDAGLRERLYRSWQKALARSLDWSA